MILPGVRTGSRSVIGAGSVVTRDVPEGVFAAGYLVAPSATSANRPQRPAAQSLE